MSRRSEQIAAVLQRESQAAIARGFQDPRIRGLITVTEVRLVESGKVAIIKVSIYPEERETLTMHGLHAAAKHLRHEISDRVALRSIPEIRFELDRGLKNQAKIYETLSRDDVLPASDAEGEEPSADAGEEAGETPGPEEPVIKPKPSAWGKLPEDTP